MKRRTASRQLLQTSSLSDKELREAATARYLDERAKEKTSRAKGKRGRASSLFSPRLSKSTKKEAKRKRKDLKKRRKEREKKRHELGADEERIEMVPLDEDSPEQHTWHNNDRPRHNRAPAYGVDGDGHTNDDDDDDDDDNDCHYANSDEDDFARRSKRY